MSRRMLLAASCALAVLVLVLLALRASRAGRTPESPRALAVTQAQQAPPTAAELASRERAPVAEPASLRPALRVLGTVRDVNGALAGASIELWPDEASDPHPSAPLAKLQSSSDGAFSFPVSAARPYLLSCTAPGHDETSAVARPDEPVELYLARLEATIELHGRVQANSNEPVADFELSVFSRRGNSFDAIWSSKPIHSPTGDFRIRVGLRTQCSDLSVMAASPGFDAGAKTVESAREGSSIDVGVIELERLRTAIEGIVEEAASHRPIAHAHLDVLTRPRGPQRDVESAADGTFRLSVSDEETPEAVTVWAEGYAPRVIELAGPAVPRIDGRLHVELSAGATIHGFVECVGDAKTAGLRVVCWEQQGRREGPWEPTHLRGLGNVGTNGEFELTHIAPEPLYIGLYREVRDGGRREISSSQLQTIWPKEGAKLEVGFRVGAGARVGVPIRANRSGFFVFGRLLDSSGTLVSSTETLSGGDLVFTDVARGHYEIRVCTADIERFLSRSIDVAGKDLILEEWDITSMPRKH